MRRQCSLNSFFLAGFKEMIKMRDFARMLLGFAGFCAIVLVSGDNALPHDRIIYIHPEFLPCSVTSPCKWTICNWDRRTNPFHHNCRQVQATCTCPENKVCVISESIETLPSLFIKKHFCMAHNNNNYLS